MVADPILMLALLPFLPFLILQYQMAMLQQLAAAPQQSGGRTKVTSITRTGSTLDIIEKWV